MRDTAVPDALGKASKNLAQCVRKITPTASRAALSSSQYEVLIGIGIALDWIGWARGLTSISYINPKRGSFERAYATGELTRFTFMWTAANALFSRESILKLIDPLSSVKGSELERFRILFNHAALLDTDTKLWIKNLHAILSLPMHVRYFPWKAVNSPPTVLEVIYLKYTVAGEQTRALGKKLHNAASTSNYVALDLPTLIYATRNWNIHGVLLSSSFRGTIKKFNVWINTINLSLAKIMDGATNAIRAAL